MNAGYHASRIGSQPPLFLLIRIEAIDDDVVDSLSLLRTFYAEGLVCNRAFLAWLVQQMATCNLAQLGFVCGLADEYLNGMLISRALTRPFVDACLSRLREVSAILPVPIFFLSHKVIVAVHLGKRFAEQYGTDAERLGLCEFRFGICSYESFVNLIVLVVFREHSLPFPTHS